MPQGFKKEIMPHLDSEKIGNISQFILKGIRRQENDRPISLRTTNILNKILAYCLPQYIKKRAHPDRVGFFLCSEVKMVKW